MEKVDFYSGRLTFINSGIFPELPSGGSPAVLVVAGGGGWYYCTSTTTSTTSTTTKIATEARRFSPQSARGFSLLSMTDPRPIAVHIFRLDVPSHAF